MKLVKNIILAGPKKVTIFDKNKIVMRDLSSNFYLQEEDIGKRRDEISLKKLKELNNYVECDYLKDDYKNISDLIDEYDVIVITVIIDINEIKKINKLCHEKKKALFIALFLV